MSGVYFLAFQLFPFCDRINCNSQESFIMTKIVLDPNLRHRLPDLTQPFEVCDEAGKTVGRFVPTGKGAEPPISRDEIDRRKQNKGKTYTTAEVLAHLEKL
jgi:hypothetical protein